MGTDDPNRRRFLTGAGAGLTAVVAGCVGDGEELPVSKSTPTATATPTASTETETETDSPTPDPSMSTVFHFSGGESTQKHAVANVANLLNDDSVDLGDVALVANGAGIKLLVAGDSTVADDVRKLLDRGVNFCACHNSMQAFGITEDDLVDSEIEVVPSGVGALTEFQAGEGYAYIKTP